MIPRWACERSFFILNNEIDYAGGVVKTKTVGGPVPSLVSVSITTSDETMVRVVKSVCVGRLKQAMD
jgi:hypothetical protein